jgi:hypothetical protein
METFANVGNIPAAANKHGNIMAAYRSLQNKTKTQGWKPTLMLETYPPLLTNMET